MAIEGRPLYLIDMLVYWLQIHKIYEMYTKP